MNVGRTEALTVARKITDICRVSKNQEQALQALSGIRAEIDLEYEVLKDMCEFRKLPKE